MRCNGIRKVLVAFEQTSDGSRTSLLRRLVASLANDQGVISFEI